MICLDSTQTKFFHCILAHVTITTYTKDYFSKCRDLLNIEPNTLTILLVIYFQMPFKYLFIYWALNPLYSSFPLLIPWIHFLYDEHIKKKRSMISHYLLCWVSSHFIFFFLINISIIGAVFFNILTCHLSCWCYELYCTSCCVWSAVLQNVQKIFINDLESTPIHWLEYSFLLEFIFFVYSEDLI